MRQTIFAALAALCVLGFTGSARAGDCCTKKVTIDHKVPDGYKVIRYKHYKRVFDGYRTKRVHKYKHVKKVVTKKVPCNACKEPVRAKKQVVPVIIEVQPVVHIRRSVIKYDNQPHVYAPRTPCCQTAYTDLRAKFIKKCPNDRGHVVWLYRGSDGTIYQMDVPRRHRHDLIRVYTSGKIIWWPAG